MPRKALRNILDLGPEESASMRPRLLCPGKLRLFLLMVLRLLGFNEAEAVMPRKAHLRTWQAKALDRLQ